MTKMRKTLVLMFFMTLLFSTLAVAQSTNPWSADATGAEENTFTTLKDVYIKSNSVCEPATEVDLYIVEDVEVWEGEEFLEDVRGSPQSVLLENSKIPLSKVWSKPDAGDYDIVLDCNQNAVYNKFIDKVDSFSETGFIVEAVAGTGEASVGGKDTGDSIWQYDPEDPDLINEMLQINLLASGEDIELKNITIKASGTGDDMEIVALEVYVDENNNGDVDGDEIMIGDFQPAYSEDDGVTTLELEYFLTKDLSENIIIAYLMEETLTEGEFSLEVESIYGVGADSAEIIGFSGLPLDSGTRTLSPAKSCLGTLNLELDPNPAPVKTKVTVRVSNLTDCENKTVSLRKNPCGSSLKEEVDSCAVKDGECTMKFNALKSETYHACVDKNEDSDAVDFGEYAFEDLIVTAEVLEPEEAENITEAAEEPGEPEEIEEEGETAGITGSAIAAGQQIAASSSFFILLEITLLLILFVLVMILFKLKGPVKSEEEKEED